MLPLSTVVYRLLWAALLGAAIGVERSVRKRPAGMRTSVCVCLGAAHFTILSAEYARMTGDPAATRIASNIVESIGFLGAGVILRERGSVVGLTTAATIFVEAGIGMGAGAGMYRISGAAAGLVLLSLVGLMYTENLLKLKRRYMLFRVACDSVADMVPEVHRIFDQVGVKLDNFHASASGDKHFVQFEADLTRHQQERVLAGLIRPGVSVDMLPFERQQE